MRTHTVRIRYIPAAANRPLEIEGCNPIYLLPLFQSVRSMNSAGGKKSFFSVLASFLPTRFPSYTRRGKTILSQKRGGEEVSCYRIYCLPPPPIRRKRNIDVNFWKCQRTPLSFKGNLFGKSLIFSNIREKERKRSGLETRRDLHRLIAVGGEREKEREKNPTFRFPSSMCAHYFSYSASLSCALPMAQYTISEQTK